jgi:hypothetical protein
LEKVYFETSAFNYLLKSIRFESFLNTRELQRRRGRQLFVSPVTLWEAMLTGKNSDFLLFAAQNLFSEQMLAAPSEIIVRYLLNAYPENKVNYKIFTDLELGNIWGRMAHDNSVTFQYDKEKLREKTKFLRSISTNLSSIVKYPTITPSDPNLQGVANIVHTYYECLYDDGFLPKREGKRYDLEILYKLFILIVLVFFILNLDLDSGVIEDFWRNVGLAENDETKRVMYIFEKYPELLKRGPLLEITIMAYHQLQLGRKNRGLIMDSFHMVYAPYVDTIISADQDFSELRSQEKHYSRKLVHISEINLREAPFISRSSS